MLGRGNRDVHSSHGTVNELQPWGKRAFQLFLSRGCQTVVLDNLKQDLVYAIRGVRRKPAFAIAVVTTLALGIGANAAMFGIVDRLLFRPPALLKDPETAHRVYL